MLRLKGLKLCLHVNKLLWLCRCVCKCQGWPSGAALADISYSLYYTCQLLFRDIGSLHCRASNHSHSWRATLHVPAASEENQTHSIHQGTSEFMRQGRGRVRMQSRQPCAYAWSSYDSDMNALLNKCLNPRLPEALSDDNLHARPLGYGFLRHVSWPVVVRPTK